MRRELGSTERAFAMTAGRGKLNAVVVARLEGGPSASDLEGSFLALQDRVPLLRSRIVRRRRHWFFESDDAGPAAPLEALTREDDRSWIDVVENELMRDFDLDRGPLVRCLHLAAPRGPHEVVLSFAHPVMDATFAVASLRWLLGLPPSGGDRQPAARSPDSRLPPGWRGARGRLRLAGFLARQMGDELLYRARARRSRPRPARPPGRCRILTMEQDEESSARLAWSCRRRRVTVPSALQAAMLLAVVRHRPRPAPLRYFAFPDLRPYLQPAPPAEEAGAFTAPMRFTLDPHPDGDLWRLARTVQEQTLRAFRSGSKFTASRAAPLAMRAVFASPRERMATTALSFTGPAGLAALEDTTVLRELHGFTSNFHQGPEFTAQVRWFRGRLSWDFVYLREDMDEAGAAAIAGEIREILDSSRPDRA